MKALEFDSSKKYLTVIKNEIQHQLTYRFNIIGYRVGNFFELFFQIIIWSIIFQKVELVRGYTYEEMVSYIVIGWLFMYLTGNYGIESIIENNISEGKITEFLLKPISYLKYIFCYSIGRASIALISAVIIQTVIIWFYSDVIVFNLDIKRIILLIAMVMATFVLRIFLSMILGMIAFWTDRIAGIDYSFNVVSRFLSGSYFTLSLLPPAVLIMCKFLPFAYTFYYPTQLYLGKISFSEGLAALGIEILWIIGLYVIIKIIWRRGIKKYEGVGI